MSTTFDKAAGEAGKRDGMDRAQLNADEYWWQCMVECAKAVARHKPYLLTDDVVRLCKERHPNLFTHEPRAMGPVMREGARLGYFTKTQDWVESTQKQCHRRPMRIWFSLICGGVKRKPPRKRKINDPRQYTMSFDEDDNDE
jgi:hypothetical protein